MAGGLLAGYGTFATYVGWFLFPRKRMSTRWQFVADLAGVRLGDSLTYQSPAGQKVVISRTGEAGQADDFIALSSVCPHLGCQVHWEDQNQQFFCPCHNGAFDSEGNPIAGPVKDANQKLMRYPLMVENGLLFIEAETESLV